MREPEIEMVAIKELGAWARNARKHSREQIRQIAQSIRTFGFTNPVLIDRDNTILAGHGRVEAARLIGMEQVPCLRLEPMTPAQKRAYVLADNKLALNAGWNRKLLADELQALSEVDINFDVEITGFTISEIDGLFERRKPEAPESRGDNVLPACDEGSPRCRVGDIWRLGRHRLICSDAADGHAIAALMDGEVATMAFTGPPVNAPNDGTGIVTGHDASFPSSGATRRQEFTAYLARVFNNLCRFSRTGSIHFVAIDWRHMAAVLAAGEMVFSQLKDLVVLVKDDGSIGSLYRSRHELIFVFANGAPPAGSAPESGRRRRAKTNVWTLDDVGTPKTGRGDGRHPTVKPVQMIAGAIEDASEKDDIVLDLFGGPGSTLIAAHKTGRRAYLCESDPIYCDRIISRWEAYAKDDAEQIACGLDRETPDMEAAR